MHSADVPRQRGTRVTGGAAGGPGYAGPAAALSGGRRRPRGGYPQGELSTPVDGPVENHIGVIRLLPLGGEHEAERDQAHADDDVPVAQIVHAGDLLAGDVVDR